MIFCLLHPDKICQQYLVHVPTNSIIRARRSRSAAAYSHQTLSWTICRSVRPCVGPSVRPVHCGKTADRIRMPFGVIGRTGPGMRQLVGFGDRFTGRGTFGGEFGARHCDQWGLYGNVFYGVRVLQCRNAALFPTHFGQTCSYILKIIYIISEENKLLPSTHHTWKMSTHYLVKCTTLSSDWRCVSFFQTLVAVTKSQLWFGIGGSENNRLWCVANGMSLRQATLQQMFIVTTFCTDTCFQCFSPLINRIIHHAVVKFSQCRNN